tara:strand:- start:87 stop:527 length:441 start_codon:yes stop_codon:yes gene_type:complete
MVLCGFTAQHLNVLLFLFYSSPLSVLFSSRDILIIENPNTKTQYQHIKTPTKHQYTIHDIPISSWVPNWSARTPSPVAPADIESENVRYDFRPLQPLHIIIIMAIIMAIPLTIITIVVVMVVIMVIVVSVNRRVLIVIRKALKIVN